MSRPKGTFGSSRAKCLWLYAAGRTRDVPWRLDEIDLFSAGLAAR